MKYLMLLIAVSCSSTITTKYIEREPDAGVGDGPDTDHQESDAGIADDNQSNVIDSYLDQCNNDVCVNCEPIPDDVNGMPSICEMTYPSDKEYSYYCNFVPDGCISIQEPSIPNGIFVLCCTVKLY
jgi:hypothetical protein